VNLHHLPNEFPVSECYLVGVSGGRDSTALLELLADAGYRNLYVCHLNHRLRPEADEDAEFVVKLAQRLAQGVWVEQEDVGELAKAQGLSIEAAARQARLELFSRAALDYGTNRVFLAHHADDQAETLLIRLLRGSGAAGLGGMDRVSQVHGLTLLRPLLDYRRAEIPEPQAYREDASNASDDFLRNRVRRQVIPILDEAMGRDITPALVRAADLLRAENEWMDQETEAAFAELNDEKGQLAVPGMRDLPLALQRRVIHRWLGFWLIRDIRFDTVEAVRALLEPGAKIAKINLTEDRHVRRREKRLFIE